MLANSAGELFQLSIGALLGTVVSINLGRFGMSLMDPKTRWKALAVIGIFLFSFLVISDLIIN